jgi:hypothetical protein
MRRYPIARTVSAERPIARRSPPWSGWFPLPIVGGGDGLVPLFFQPAGDVRHARRD